MIIRLFYSNKCNECKNLWQVICNENIKQAFVPICLDNFSLKEIEKLSIKRIPSIVVSVDNHKPSIYEGPYECSKWLTTFTLNRRKNITHRVEQQRKIIQNENTQIRNTEGGPVEYTATEMEGISDDYAYLNTDLSHPKSFLPIGMDTTISTPQNDTLSKLTYNDISTKKDMLEKTRLSDEEQIKHYMENKQINAVINYNPHI